MFQDFPVPVYCPVMGLCVEWELLQEGASRMMAEPGSDLCCLSLVWLMGVPGRKSAMVFLKPKRYEKGLVCVGAESIPNKDENK